MSHFWVTRKALKLLGLLQPPGEAVNEEALALWARQRVVTDHIQDDTLKGKRVGGSVALGTSSLVWSPWQVLFLGLDLRVNLGEHLPCPVPGILRQRWCPGTSRGISGGPVTIHWAGICCVLGLLGPIYSSLLPYRWALG